MKAIECVEAALALVMDNADESKNTRGGVIGYTLELNADQTRRLRNLLVLAIRIMPQNEN